MFIDDNMTPESAQEVFLSLINENRSRALWFLKPELNYDIRTAEADRILDEIAVRTTRATWATVRKLKKWRSRNFK
jgi:hypothetical protein